MPENSPQEKVPVFNKQRFFERMIEYGVDQETMGYLSLTIEYLEKNELADESLDTDMSILFNKMSVSAFGVVMKNMGILYRQMRGKEMCLELTFVINDPDRKKFYPNEVMLLRALKGFKEEYPKNIRKIIVKGPKGTPAMEPNVFSSGIDFVEMP